MMLFWLLLIFFVVGARATGASESAHCSIFVKDLHKTLPPLILQGEGDGFLYPESAGGEIRVNVSNTIKVACTPETTATRKDNHIHILIRDELGGEPYTTSTNKDVMRLRCMGNKTFVEDVGLVGKAGKKNQKNPKPSTSGGVSTERQLEIKNIKCNYLNGAEIILERTKRKCGTRRNEDVKEIVFKMKSNGNSYGLIDYCPIRSDSKRQWTAWVHSKIRPYLRYDFVTPPRDPKKDKWTNNDASNAVIEKDFYKNYQDSLRKSRIPDNVPLDRGHFIANADMYWPYQRDATYDYVNSVPQWRSINSGNWKKVEELIGDFVTKKGREMDVWVGGMGTMKHGTEEYNLEHTSKHLKSVPIPAYLYEIVSDRTNKQGVVFITINNPFVKLEGIENLIKCNDILSRIPRMNRANYPHWSHTRDIPFYPGMLAGVIFPSTELMEFPSSRGQA